MSFNVDRIFFPFEVTYETNADWHLTYEKASKMQHVVKAEPSEKGLLCLYFNGLNIKAQLSPKGKLVLSCKNVSDKEKCFPLLTEVLTPPNGEPLELVPLYVNVWRVPSTIKDNFQLPWCEEWFGYQKIRNPHLKRTAELLRLQHRLAGEEVDGPIWGTPFFVLVPPIAERLKLFRKMLREIEKLNDPEERSKILTELIRQMFPGIIQNNKFV